MISYKNRQIDYTQTVLVYRNLNQDCYYIVQKGKVVAHAKKLILADVTFKVRESGRQKVLKTKRKNVHAFAKGLLVESAMGITSEDFRILRARILYNPYKYGCFYCDNLTSKPFGVKSCMVVKFNENGLTGAYLDKCDLKL
jgi:hypothetical protein